MAVEVLREPQAPPPDPSAIGGVAARRHLHLVEGQGPRVEFEPWEIRVFDLLSQGNTLNQIARQMDYMRSTVRAAEESAMEKAGTHSKTVLVDRFINLGLIPVEVEPDQDVLADITDLDRRMIGLYARGVTNHTIAKHGKAELDQVESYHDGLLERLGAWSRPHAIRRSYELGIREVSPRPTLAVPASPAQTLPANPE